MQQKQASQHAAAERSLQRLVPFMRLKYTISNLAQVKPHAEERRWKVSSAFRKASPSRTTNTVDAREEKSCESRLYSFTIPCAELAQCYKVGLLLPLAVVDHCQSI